LFACTHDALVLSLSDTRLPRLRSEVHVF
jgi:hypothetical protein